MLLADRYPFYLGNERHSPNTDLEVKDKYTGEVATRVALASTDDIDRAIGATVDATEPMRKLAPYERQAILQHCVICFQERFDELAMGLALGHQTQLSDDSQYKLLLVADKRCRTKTAT